MSEVSVISGNIVNKEAYDLGDEFKITNQGYPIMGVDVQILDDNHKEITEPNKEGFIVLKSPGPLTACVGYWNN